VVRAGWSRAFDRINGVGIVLTPALGIGFGDLSVCRAPDTAGVCGNGGDPTSNFRIGVDGNHVTVPALPTLSGGVIIPGLGCPGGGTLCPANANSVFENSDSRLDPKNRIGSADMIDFSIQRELPGKMLLEVGYVGRFARNLFLNIDLNHIPYMFTPKGTNQSFAQAFDKVAAQLQAGTSTRAVTLQPALEALLGGLSSPLCSAVRVYGVLPGRPSLLARLLLPSLTLKTAIHTGHLTALELCGT